MPIDANITDLRKQLLKNGYTPLANVDKVCVLKGWPKLQVTEKLIDSWSRMLKYKATGIRLDGKLAVLDIDIDTDEDKADQIDALLAETCPALYGSPTRFGKGTKIAVFFRTDDDWQMLQTPHFTDPDGRQHAVECFGPGVNARQFGCYGPHSHNPDGSVAIEYRWLNDTGPHNVPYDDLPVVSREEVAKTVDALWKLMKGWGWEQEENKFAITGEAGEKKYTLTGDMVFHCMDGEDRKLAEMYNYACGPNARCAVDFLPGRGGDHNATKCHVHVLDWTPSKWGIYLYGDDEWHLPADDEPREIVDETVQSAFAKIEGEFGFTKNSAAQSFVDSGDPFDVLEPIRPSDSYDLAVAKALAQFGHAEADNDVVDLYHRDRRIKFAYMKNSMGALVFTPPGAKKAIHVLDAWMAQRNKIVIRGSQLRPDMAWPVFEEHGHHWHNTYRRPDHGSALGGEINTFIRFMEHLVPDEAERWLVWQWFAHKVQHPEVTGPALLMVAPGVYGAGRGSFTQIIAKVIGEQYCATLPFSVIVGRDSHGFNGWQADFAVAFVNETSSPEPHMSHRAQKIATYEKLKEFIEPGKVMRIRINRKGKEAYTATSCTSIFMATNHEDAIPIGPDDRRVMIVSNGGMLPYPQARELHAWMDDPANIAALAEVLMQVKMTTYDPYAAPPMTKAKFRMIDASKSVLDDLMEQVIEECKHPLTTAEACKVRIERITGHDKAELPPGWQKAIGQWLASRFPRVENDSGERRRFKVGKVKTTAYWLSKVGDQHEDHLGPVWAQNDYSDASVLPPPLRIVKDEDQGGPADGEK